MPKFGKRLFAGIVAIKVDLFKKILHFVPKLPYIKSSFSKNQGGYQKLELKMNLQQPWTFTVVIWKYE